MNNNEVNEIEEQIKVTEKDYKEVNLDYLYEKGIIDILYKRYKYLEETADCQEEIEERDALMNLLYVYQVND